MTHDEATVLTPVQPGERIHSMDVLRGFALLGIAMMNIEFFNFSTWEFSRGLPPELTGIDRWAGWWVVVLFTGKFWVLFSLLFGMGFAVMLGRARARGAPFIRTYMRRTLALMAFGFIHSVFIWNGDILWGYGVTAFFLMLVLFGRWPHYLMGAAGVAALGLVFREPGFATFAAPLLVAPLLAGYIRAPEGLVKRTGYFKLLFVIATVLGIAGIVLMVMQDFGSGGPTFTLGVLFGVLAWLAWRYRDPVDARIWRAGLGLCALFTMMQVIGGAATMAFPKFQEPATVEQRKAIAEGIAKSEQNEADEIRAFRSPDYTVGLTRRFKSATHHHLPMYGFFSIIALPFFLIGYWLVQSRKLANAAREQAFWQRWRWAWLPALAVTIASMYVGSWMPRGVNVDIGPAFFGSALRLAMAPIMAMGYMAMIVLGLLAPAGKRMLSVMAPAGRMALTNYISQSVICAFVFYGFGLHQWGMPRHQQVVFVLLMWVAQVCISTIWLRHFRYGPLEWLWRWVTYGRRPAMRSAIAN